jgi:subfamily B ATP-binding cassette protein MsbA
MAIVSQDVWLLNRSLRANLTFGLHRPPAEAELWDALRDVELTELVQSLPARLETEIGDRGVRLSGGQRQRLALARALLRDPDILILDEATASLDSVLERRIEGAVERRAHGRTLIVIAHRLSTIRGADMILVMDRGRIVETGTWDQLLARHGTFERLHRAQFGRVRVAAP